MGNNEIKINKKDIEKILKYRYSIFIEVNKHLPSYNWDEAVLERDLVQKMNTTDFILKTLGLFDEWMQYYKKMKEKKDNE